MKKRTLFILILTLILCVTALVACKKATSYKGIKVVYELEGGTYQNCKEPATIYYNFKKDKATEHLIKPLEKLADKASFYRVGYDFIGWYKVKEVNGDVVTYSEPWDFEKDKIDEKGITLYACWKKSAKYTFEVIDIDDINGEGYPIAVEEKLLFDKNFAKRKGYTAVEFYADAEGTTPWDDTFRHPGGDVDTNIPVYVKYLPGTYSIVNTASEFIAAVNGGNNIYLRADVDLASFSKPDSQGRAQNELLLANYKGIIYGNGHTVKNFSVYYSARNSDLVPDFTDESKKCLAIGLFEGADGAIIKDITFENVTIKVDVTNSQIYAVYAAPIAVSAANCTLENVNVDIKLKIEKLPSGVTEVVLPTVVDAATGTYQPVTYASGEMTISNTTATITVMEE